MPDALVSAPLTWEEVPDAELGDFSVKSMPARVRAVGDPSTGLHERAFSLDFLLDLAARDEVEGLGDAPWPPHFAKQKGEPKPVQPSKAKAKAVEGEGEDVGRRRRFAQPQRGGPRPPASWASEVF